MQSTRESIRRGFTIYRVCLEIDFSGSLWGYTILTVHPTTRDLRTVHLHSRQCTIHNVTVASDQADFVHYDPLSNMTISNPQDVHTHPELKRRLYSALADGDEGELSIAIPEGVLKPSGHSVAGLAIGTPEPHGAGLPQSQQTQTEFESFSILIEYSLRNPADGINFVLPSDAYPHRAPHVYTTPSSPDTARCWVPCIDSLWQRQTWDFEFIVPRCLEERDEEQADDDGDVQGEHPTVVVCSGDLVEIVAHPYNSSKSIFIFSQGSPVSSQHVGFAAGPFHVLQITKETTSHDATDDTHQVPMTAFCLPGQEAALSSSVLFLRQAMSFYVSEFGSYPFGAYKLVFVDDLHVTRFDSVTMSIVSLDLLHGDDAIDQVYETRQVLSHALAVQWAGINILPKLWSDLWLVNGLGLYIAAQFLRKLLGNNEYRFRLKKDMERTIEWDNGGMPPICQPMVYDPPEASILPFINLKAPLVLHILDRRLGKSGTSLGLSRVLPKLFLSAISGDLPNNTLSTHGFLRTCRKVSGVDLRSFAEQWIYGSGCPAFGFTASFNRKKMAVEITMRQDAPAWKAHEHDEVRQALLKPVSFFEGQMTIRIHEADGTPYEHVLDIRAPFKRYEVPFNTKYKRVRRNTKRYQARQQAAQAAAEGDQEAAEAMGMVDMGFGLEIWEKESERELWKVADWTEEDEAVMNGATYEWIRMDADFEWIATIVFDQPDFMWVSQLQRDRDVVAQLEAVNALAKMPNAIVSSTLTKTALVTNYFFRIRCEAVAALVTCAIRRANFLGLFHLFKLFLRYCEDPEDPNQDLFTHRYVPKLNDFSDFSEYFVRRALVKAISQVRFENGMVPAVVRQFLIDQLKYNDNTSNPFTDTFYICTLISSLACATVCTSPPERGELAGTQVQNQFNEEDMRLLKDAVDAVDRYREMDRLIASPHNAVTVATLEFRLILSVANLITNDPKIWFPLTREGNYAQVRIAAFDSLFFTKWYTTKIMKYVLAVMAHDSSRLVRRHIARNAGQSLALLAAMGELKASSKESESLLIEEDGNPHEKVAKENKKSDVDMLIKTLRKDKELGKNDVVREFLLPIALAPDADYEVRWAVLKFADILIRGAEETAPKLSIHIPPTPITDIAPPLPLVKLPAKPRPNKAGTSVVTPVASSLKLRLPPSTPTIETSHPPPFVPPLVTPATPAPARVSFDASAIVSKKGNKPSIAKPKVAKAVPKAQSGGMDIFDLKASRSILQKLQNHKSAFLFRQPVDPVRDQAPNYFEVIKSPMDLGTMRGKLETGGYPNRFAFEADFRLMTRNAKTYNPPDTYVFKETTRLETYFEQQWARTNKTIEKAEQAQPKPKPKLMAPPPVPIGVPPARPDKPIVKIGKTPGTPLASTPGPSDGGTKLKLKLGGPSRNGETPAPTPAPPAPSPVSMLPATPTPAPKPKPRKPKPAHTPARAALPDDGTLELLEEVIAIEGQKNEERGRNHANGPSSSSAPVRRPNIPEKPLKLNLGNKRKKDSVSNALGDDELLDLASPIKKRSRSRSPAAPTPERKEARPPKAGSSIKFKKPSDASASSALTPPPLPLPQASPALSAIPTGPVAELKGKEKERPSTPASQTSKTSTPQPMPSGAGAPLNRAKCKELLRNILKLSEAMIFARPVDPILDGCPTYYEEIAHPMDLKTMGEKVNSGAYSTMEQFQKDMELMLANCRQFNPPGTGPVQCADAIEQAFKKEWPKAMERKLSYAEKRSLLSVMNTISKEDISFVFREPVDPVGLGIPTYFDVIPRKNARDLRTIRQKLDQDKYESITVWEADVDLMVQNAIRFNGAESEVGLIALQFQARIDELVANLKGGVYGVLYTEGAIIGQTPFVLKRGHVTRRHKAKTSPRARSIL
ncbi:hypothetical protein K488DRAFT_80600 [Vararia minispora EC-137]|uniref:Uncharacterized protein n=1 Tax=Vararia minispora EC-137 TaxID=1314806 RepID=A0ACB8QAB7_9AGAM|nr:hypothetical protein K488DRAFT_80600 [Vararia minispora EC-137]